jgi:hypothetical protein
MLKFAQLASVGTNEIHYLILNKSHLDPPRVNIEKIHGSSPLAYER